MCVIRYPIRQNRAHAHLVDPAVSFEIAGKCENDVVLAFCHKMSYQSCELGVGDPVRRVVGGHLYLSSVGRRTFRAGIVIHLAAFGHKYDIVRIFSWACCIVYVSCAHNVDLRDLSLWM